MQRSRIENGGEFAVHPNDANRNIASVLRILVQKTDDNNRRMFNLVTLTIKAKDTAISAGQVSSKCWRHAHLLRIQQSRECQSKLTTLFTHLLSCMRLNEKWATSRVSSPH